MRPACSAPCTRHTPGPPGPQEELLASDLASALAQMHAVGRYGQLLLLADTCQASTLYARIAAPNVLGVASSKLGEAAPGAQGGLGDPAVTAGCEPVSAPRWLQHQAAWGRRQHVCGAIAQACSSCRPGKPASRCPGPRPWPRASDALAYRPWPSCAGQSSYAHHIDTTIGQHVVDQFTYHLHHFLTSRVPPSTSGAGGYSGGAGAAAPSLQQLLDFIRSQRMSSEVQVRRLQRCGRGWSNASCSVELAARVVLGGIHSAALFLHSVRHAAGMARCKASPCTSAPGPCRSAQTSSPTGCTMWQSPHSLGTAGRLRGSKRLPPLWMEVRALHTAAMQHRHCCSMQQRRLGRQQRRMKLRMHQPGHPGSLSSSLSRPMGGRFLKRWKQQAPPVCGKAKESLWHPCLELQGHGELRLCFPGGYFRLPVASRLSGLLFLFAWDMIAITKQTRS